MGCMPVTTITFSSHAVDLRNPQQVNISCQATHQLIVLNINCSIKLVKRGVGELCTLNHITTRSSRRGYRCNHINIVVCVSLQNRSRLSSLSYYFPLMVDNGTNYFSHSQYAAPTGSLVINGTIKSPNMSDTGNYSCSLLWNETVSGHSMLIDSVELPFKVYGECLTVYYAIRNKLLC